MNNLPFNTPRSEERLTHIRQENRSVPVKPPLFLNIILNTIWCICHFLFYFIQQIAEIFAPLLLVIGIVWKILPVAAMSLIKTVSTSDPQTGDIIRHGSTLIPYSLTLSGHTFTASQFIMDGFLLLALTAICATLTAFLGRKL